MVFIVALRGPWCWYLQSLRVITHPTTCCKLQKVLLTAKKSLVHAAQKSTGYVRVLGQDVSNRDCCSAMQERKSHNGVLDTVLALLTALISVVEISFYMQSPVGQKNQTTPKHRSQHDCNIRKIKNARTTGWCLFNSPTTSLSLHCCSTSLMGESVNVATIGEARKGQLASQFTMRKLTRCTHKLTTPQQKVFSPLESCFLLMSKSQLPRFPT